MDVAATAIAGFCAGMARVAVSYPLDHIRTHQQATGMSLSAAWRAVGGVRNMYRASSISFATVGTERMVQFVVFETAQARGWPVMLGGAAGATASTAVGLAGQALLTQRIVHGVSIREAARMCWSRPKDIGFGAVAEFGRSCIAGTTYLTIYGNLRTHPDTRDWGPAVHGICANMAAVAVGYPLETIRVRLHSGFRNLRGLYKGFGIAIVRTIPSAAVGMTVYEHVRGLLTLV